MFVKILFPKIKASPEVGARRPTSMEIVVLFPAPLCPAKPIRGRKKISIKEKYHCSQPIKQFGRKN